MDTTLYNDSRPEDGMDQQERERAEQERYDLETIERFDALAKRALFSPLLSDRSKRLILDYVPRAAGVLGYLVERGEV